eukprot:4334932-Pleurochrysis_carterae.AAC.1
MLSLRGHGLAAACAFAQRIWDLIRLSPMCKHLLRPSLTPLSRFEAVLSAEKRRLSLARACASQVPTGISRLSTDSGGLNARGGRHGAEAREAEQGTLLAFARKLHGGGGAGGGGAGGGSALHAVAAEPSRISPCKKDGNSPSSPRKAEAFDASEERAFARHLDVVLASDPFLKGTLPLSREREANGGDGAEGGGDGGGRGGTTAATALMAAVSAGV